MSFLLGHDIPRTVKFDCRPQLDAFARELTEAFVARYEKPPSVEPSLSRDMVVYRHYRMSLDVVARPLTTFCSMWEFVSAMVGKASFADSGLLTNFSPPQRISMLASMLMSFIVTSA